jgi:hypothetical protein
MTRPRLAGWKHRRALSLLVLRDWPWVGVTALAEALALACVNLPFLLVQTGGNGAWGCLGMEQDQRHEAEDLAAAMSRWWGWPAPEFVEPVAALTIYPLDGGLALPALGLACLAQAGLRPLAMGTSPAALTVILPEAALPAAVDAFGRSFALPPDTSPPDERVKVVQSPQQREN